MSVAEASPGWSREEAAAAGMVLAWHAAQAPARPAILSEHGNRSFAELNVPAILPLRAPRPPLRPS